MPIRRRRSNNKNEGEVQKLSTLLTFFLALIVFVLLVTVGGTVTYYALTLDLPGIDALKDYRPSIASRVYDDTNELIDEFFLEDRKVVRIAEVPKIVRYAFVAAEDSRFYQHQGLDMLHLISDKEVQIVFQRIYEKLSLEGTLLVRATIPSDKENPWKHWIEVAKLKITHTPARFRGEKEIVDFMKEARFAVSVSASDTTEIEEKWFVGKKSNPGK